MIATVGDRVLVVVFEDGARAMMAYDGSPAAGMLRACQLFPAFVGALWEPLPDETWSATAPEVADG